MIECNKYKMLHWFVYIVNCSIYLLLCEAQNCLWISPRMILNEKKTGLSNGKYGIIKIWIYWSESNSRIYFCIIFLNKNWKIYWSKYSFTGLDRCSSWGLNEWWIWLTRSFKPQVKYFFVTSVLHLNMIYF
jgi:hypothetical protein